MGVKTRDNRVNEDIVETSLTQILKDFSKFRKEPRFRYYPENELLGVYRNIVWMSEIDRRTINAIEIARKRQQENILRSKARELNYPRWSEDPSSTKVKQIPTTTRLMIIAGVILFLIIIVLVILTLTKWLSAGTF